MKELLISGVHVLPRFLKDTTDRNRTSPFAFTGNKFEFRMLGSSASISDANVILNTAVAEELKQFADILENTEDFKTALSDLIRRTIIDHKRIIFNGNGYDDAWVRESEKRGLLNLKSTPDCLPYLLKQKNISLFTSHKVFSETELHSRYEIFLENYCKVLNIEALTMIDMARKDILPAASAYARVLAETITAKRDPGLSAALDCSYEEELAGRISGLASTMYSKVKALENAVLRVRDISDITLLSVYYKDSVITAMNELRINADELETLTAKKFWPYPSYGEILFSIR